MYDLFAQPIVGNGGQTNYLNASSRDGAIDHGHNKLRTIQLPSNPVQPIIHIESN